MGISKFYSWIEDKCPDAKQRMNLSDLVNKTIAVDVSILLYRFKKQDHLIPKMFLFCNLCRRFKITPIFVFDGIPDRTKWTTIHKRNETKQQYYEKYLNLKKTLDTYSLDKEDSATIKEQEKMKTDLQYLYNQSISIGKNEIENVKELLTLYGMNWVVANGEADHYCCEMFHSGEVYGVLSDDSDMFALGCKRIFRFLDVLNHTVVMYDLDKICKSLNIDTQTFQWLCSISRNDYRPETTNDTIDEIYNQLLYLPLEWRYEDNHNPCISKSNHSSSFSNKQDKYEHKTIRNKTYNKKQLMNHMEIYGFIH